MDDFCISVQAFSVCLRERISFCGGLCRKITVTFVEAALACCVQVLSRLARVVWQCDNLEVHSGYKCTSVYVYFGCGTQPVQVVAHSCGFKECALLASQLNAIYYVFQFTKSWVRHTKNERSRFQD